MNTTIAMSVAKPFTTTPTQIPSTSQHCRHRRHLRPLILVPIKCQNNSNIDITTTASNNNSGNTSSPADPPPTPPPKAVEIRFRRGSRRKSRQKEQQDGVGVATRLPKKAPPKDWDSMTFSEKAIELYVGEKGLLFWLNKLAYAAIFVIIGAWILFRFVGPALNLYQLDSAPLPPTSIFKGS